VFQQSDDVGGNEKRLTPSVEVNGGQRSGTELRRATEQRLDAGLCRQVEQNDGAVFAGAN